MNNYYLIDAWSQIVINGIKYPYEISSSGIVKNIKTGYILKPRIGRGGYYSVEIKTKHKKKHIRTTASIHKLVAIAFIPIPEIYINQGLSYDDLTVNHEDGNKFNNTANNLSWCTRGENTQHAIRTGLCVGIFGELSHLSKIDNDTAKLCCEMLADGKTPSDISDELNISVATVRHIRSGTTWKHISKDFNFPDNNQIKPYSIDDSTIHEICKMLETKQYKDTMIASKFGCTREYVRDIRTHKRRREISKYYNF